ncbi:MAG: hypothetical protein WKF80_00995 [Thermomicrobiales bacterium]
MGTSERMSADDERDDGRGDDTDGERDDGASRDAASDGLADLLDMVWPETGLQTSARVSARPRDGLTEDDLVQLRLDFVTLDLTPQEFIQLAAFLRLCVDGLLDQHPGLQRAVVRAFDIRD